MTKGIVYIAFGEKARQEAEKSIASVKAVGVDMPIVSIGDTEICGTKFIRWEGLPPFSCGGKLSFRAGEVKPLLYKLSHFKNTLYLDADTTIKRDFTAGFDYLKDNDVCVSYHVKPNGETWFVDEIFGNSKLSPPISDTSVREREITQGMIGKRMPFINTGVIFFRAFQAASLFFETWRDEWKIFSGWDEQMAFHRAIVKCPKAKIMLLPPVWNQKYENKDTIILHHMGKRAARKEQHE
jgi:hypothetical protein